jgi:acyl-CoA thioesterase
VQGDEAPAPLFELDADTDVIPDPTSDGAVLGKGVLRWRCELTDRWNIATGLNGGYIGAVLARAAIAASSHPDPMAMTTHYLDRPAPGPAWLDVELLRQGRSHTTVEVRLMQDDNAHAVLKAAATVTLGRRRLAGGSDFQASAPSSPPPAACMEVRRAPAGTASLLDRVRYRIAEGHERLFAQQDSSADDGSRLALLQGWIRLSDGRPADAIAVPLFLDCWPPSVFGRVERTIGGGVPTLEMTVYWRGDVGAGWHLARFTTGTVAGGYLEEDGELWDEKGRLVAMSRQLALFIDRSRATSPPA